MAKMFGVKIYRLLEKTLENTLIIYGYINKESNFERIYMNGEDFLKRLCESSEEIKITEKERMANINLSDTRVDRLIKTIKQLGEPKDKEEYIRAILREPTNDNGLVYELLAYNWLLEHNIQFDMHPILEKEECLKEKAEYYKADGRIENIFFDIKSFSFGLPRYTELLNKLNEIISKRHDEKISDFIVQRPVGEIERTDIKTNQEQKTLGDYLITVSGKADLSSDVFKKVLRDGSEQILKLLFATPPINNDYFYEIDSIEIRAHYNRKRRAITVSTFNDDEWAFNNQYQLLKHGSQFCRIKPFIIICAYDNYKCNRMMYSSTAFKTLCRRMFMLHTKIENRKLFEFDGKSDKKVSVAMAAKKLSGVFFMDVSDEADIFGDMLFVNPNADNPLFAYQVNSFFRYNGVVIEDYRFDNY